MQNDYGSWRIGINHEINNLIQGAITVKFIECRLAETHNENGTTHPLKFRLQTKRKAKEAKDREYCGGPEEHEEDCSLKGLN